MGNGWRTRGNLSLSGASGVHNRQVVSCDGWPRISRWNCLGASVYDMGGMGKGGERVLCGLVGGLGRGGELT